jgi:hypothetical protein
LAKLIEESLIVHSAYLIELNTLAAARNVLEAWWWAWSSWFSGQHVEDQLLAGVEILWWGRAGKCIEFVAALAVLAEIIGPERLRSFGRLLRLHFSPNKPYELMNQICRVAIAAFKIAKFHGSKSDKGNKLQREFTVLYDFWGPDKLLKNLFWAFLAYGPGIYLAIIITPRIALGWPLDGIASVLFNLAAGSIVAILTAGVVLTLLATVAVLLALMVAAIEVGVISPFAWLLERNNLEPVIKSASVVLLAMGFQFDLLAS